MAIKTKTKLLIVELTRKCNAACLHCMRGNAENKDMSLETIEKILKNEDHKLVFIDRLYLTGGDVFCSESLNYFLNYIIDNDINVNNLGLCTNGLIYDQNIINLLNKLQEKGTNVYIETFMDKYHSQIPEDNLNKFLNLPYYNYYEDSLDEQRITKIGRAKENDIGNDELTEEVLLMFAMTKPHVDIVAIENNIISINNLYITVDGKFGEVPTHCSWKMIDNKYYLDINKDSLFKNASCKYGFDELVQEIKEGFIILPTDNYITDYNKAKENGELNIFLQSLDEEKIREYLTSNNSKTLNLKP